ncbi:NAD-dependent epimerase/dehydratase family protein [Chloroflexota bacterium]
MYANRNVLVTGGTGLIGRPLVELLLQAGAKVMVASLDDESRCPQGAEFIRGNLTHWDFCQKVVKNMDYVFHLAGIKGSPAMTSQKPASFFVPLISMNTNMMEAARQEGVARYLYTSTIGVYSPSEVFNEDDVWQTFPSENDKFAGWAKRMGELQAEAYKIEYGWDKIAIVRPANVYGPYDNFDPDNAMVIPSLIKRGMDGENPLVVWGDGSPIRDFIHARDVARGMLLALENITGQPINLGSGVGVAIRKIVEIIVSNLEVKPELVWDTSKPSGDKKRLMDISRARAIGFQPLISIEDGIKEVMDWYRQNRDIVNKRYNVFTEGNPA